MAKSKIIVCAHKNDFVLSNDVFRPLQVGKAQSTVNLGFDGDDTGDNISRKNPNYCELTGLYWAWKNMTDYDFVGLAHYRRYFDFSKNASKIDYVRHFSVDDFCKLQKTWQNPADALGDCDIILPNPWYMNESVSECYIKAHLPEEYHLLGRILLKNHPEYKESIRKFWCMDNRWIAYNMFFTRKEIFEDYCQWLFPMLEELERYIKVVDYPFQKRTYGFMGEILLPLYCQHNGLKIKHLPVLMLDDGQNMSPFKILLNKWRSNFIFKLSQPFNHSFPDLDSDFDDNCRRDGYNI